MRNRFLALEDEIVSTKGTRLPYMATGSGRRPGAKPKPNRFVDFEVPTALASSQSLSTAIVSKPLAVNPFSAAQKQKTLALLSPAKNQDAIKQNTAFHPGQSGADPATILTQLNQYVDTGLIQAKILDFNQQNPKTPIQITKDTINAVFVEALHQFQQKCYLATKRHNGIADLSTLNSLGIILPKSKFNTLGSNPHAQTRLKTKIIKTTIEGIAVDHSNWFDFIVNPTWLGWTTTSGGTPTGNHYLLAVLLRQAEKIWCQMPAYADMSPAELGTALHITEDHRGFRPTNTKKGFHTYGLAIDINYEGNPFIGDPEKVTKAPVFWTIIKKVAEPIKTGILWELNGKMPANINHYFVRLAEQLGDTHRIYDTLKNLNDAFQTYLRSNPAENRSLKGNDGYFSNGRDPQDGFLNFNKDLVIVLREKLCLAWGAVDFGPGASGDIMHFDMRVIPPFDRLTGEGGISDGPFWPRGIHPCQIANGWKAVLKP